MLVKGAPGDGRLQCIGKWVTFIIINYVFILALFLYDLPCIGQQGPQCTVCACACACVCIGYGTCEGHL